MSVIIQVGGKVIVDGATLPPCPSKSKQINSVVVNDRIYMNGYEFVNDKWKRTIRALWHLWF